MSTDKTLADVQPGGRVRLGDVLPPLPKMQRFTNLYGETYAYSAEQMRDYARAALSAQPSPGGQGDAVHCGKCKGRGYVHVDVDVDDSGGSIGNIEACPHCAIAAPPSHGDQDALDCIGRIEEAIEFRVPHDIYAAVHGDLAELKAALAASQPVGDYLAQDRKMVSQPVGEPVAWMAQPVLQSAQGRSSVFCSDSRLAAQWDYSGHPEYGRMIVTPLYAAPPAQAVDLGPVRDVFRRWHANELNSTDAMLALVEALAVIDSQAVGK